MQTNFERELIDLGTEVSQLGDEVNSSKGVVKTLEGQIQKLNDTLLISIKEKDINIKSVQVLDLVQKSIRDSIKDSFELVVNYALSYILDERYRLELEFDKRGNLHEAHLNIITPSNSEPADPIESDAGGCIDIVALTLRVVILSLEKPKIEGPLICDESFKHTSEGLLDNAGRFLAALNEKINRQVIMVTHKKEFIEYADNIIKL